MGGGWSREVGGRAARALRGMGLAGKSSGLPSRHPRGAVGAVEVQMVPRPDEQRLGGARHVEDEHPRCLQDSLSTQNHEGSRHHVSAQRFLLGRPESSFLGSQGGTPPAAGCSEGARLSQRAVPPRSEASTACRIDHTYLFG